MNINELLKLFCFIALILDVAYVAVDGIVYEIKNKRKDGKKDE